MVIFKNALNRLKRFFKRINTAFKGNSGWQLTKKILGRTFLGFVFALLYLPIIWLIVFSFTDTTSIKKWGGFSFQPYIDLFSGARSADIFSALGNTMIVAVSAAAIATLLGTLAAIGINSMRNKKLKSSYKLVSQIPMVNADIITAVSLMLLFTICKTFIPASSSTSILNVILAHTSFCTPYVVLNVLPRLQNMDNSIYEAALDLGAKPMQAILKAVVPQIMSGIIMGFIMSITLSIDDFVITQYTIEGFHTLSTYIYSVNAGKKPLPAEVRALSAILFLVILGLLLFINIKQTKSKTKAQKAQKGVKK